MACRPSETLYPAFSYLRPNPAAGDPAALTEHHSDDFLLDLLHAFMAGGDYVTYGMLLSDETYRMYGKFKSAATAFENSAPTATWRKFMEDEAGVGAAQEAFKEQVVKWLQSLIGEAPEAQRLPDGRYRFYLK